MTQVTQGNIRQEETYSEMVRRLFKPMGSEAADYLHCAIGITGEGLEVLSAYTGMDSNEIDRENVLEELGDARFYMERLFQLMHTKFEHFANVNDLECEKSYQLEEISEKFASPIDMFLVYAGEIQDQVKKLWVYNKQLDVILFYEAVNGLVYGYSALCREHNRSEADVQQANMYKLSTGPKARYPLGYSDSAAQARADKAV